MTKIKTANIHDVELRSLAEEVLGENRGTTCPPGIAGDQLKLLHELQVHQVELELQNEELRQTKDELVTLLEQYTDLYDFAPTGYVTLDHSGTIRRVNITGSSLLGIERSRLNGQSFKQFVASADCPAFAAFLEKTLMSPAKVTCEVALRNSSRQVQIEAVAAASGQECRLVVIDITERRKLETEIQDAREFAENIVETVREPLVVLSCDLKILTANHSFYDTFKVTPEETIGNFIYDLGNRQWDIPQLRLLFEEILPHDTVINDYEVEHAFPKIGRKIVLLNARQIFRKNIGSHIILLAMKDISERKQVEALVQVNQLRQQAQIRSIGKPLDE